MFRNIFCVLLLSLYLVGDNGVLGLPHGNQKAVGGAQDNQMQKASGGAQDHQMQKADGGAQDHQMQKAGGSGAQDNQMKKAGGDSQENQKPGGGDHKQQKDPKAKGKSKGHGHKGKGGGKDLAATCPPQVTVTVDPTSASSSADAGTATSSSSTAEATPVNNAGAAESSSSTAAAETASSSDDNTATTTAASASETTSAASADTTTSCPATVTVTVDPTSSADASSTATSAAASATDATCDTSTEDSGADSGSDAGSAVGDADFGICTVPKIEFGVGFDGRKETSFRPTDLVNYNHGSAQNIGIITQFVCDQLVNRCKANQAAKDLCAKAQAAAAAKPPKTGADADAFNEVFGEDTNFSAVQAIDDQGNPIAGSTSRRSPSLNILRSRARRAHLRRQANCASSTADAATSTSSAAPAATSASTSSSDNLQTFTGALGDIKPPAVNRGGKGFVVEGSDDFLNVAAALGRSCDIQHNKCANLANSGGGFSVGDCDQQNNECHAAIN
ncbi:hypothetical protein DL96DRAFT_147912 [Flagelloscypha sp. PMI_526]|nr:hypothetical protein DL96DRAFT_147912 [Flagelloscypha sp. PMI_526]